MEQAPKTSFIPKQSIGVAKTRERRSFNIFTFLAMVIFLATLTLAIGVFFYHRYVEQNLEGQKKALADFKDRFALSAENDIREIQLLEDRFMLAKSLLDNHLALTSLFAAIEERTQENAQITTFSFDRRPSGGAAIALTGEAASFNTVALQQREYVAESAFQDGSVAIKGVTVSEGGEDASSEPPVVFSVDAELDTGEVAYKAPLATTTTGEPSFGTTTSTTTTP